MKHHLYLLFILFIMSCRQPYNKNELVNMIRSNNLDSVVKGIEGLRAKNDTSMIPYLLENTEDTRILHSRKYYGKSIYQLKMETIEKFQELNHQLLLATNQIQLSLIFIEDIL